MKTNTKKLPINPRIVSLEGVTGVKKKSTLILEVHTHITNAIRIKSEISERKNA